VNKEAGEGKRMMRKIGGMGTRMKRWPKGGHVNT
jgi:hypothetical protein